MSGWRVSEWSRSGWMRSGWPVVSGWWWLSEREAEALAGDHAAHDLGRAAADGLADRLPPRELEVRADEDGLGSAEVARRTGDGLGGFTSGQLVRRRLDGGITAVLDAL